MGRMIDGAWVTGDLGPDAQGRYVRRTTTFRGWVTGDGSSGYPVEAGRYRLIAAHACGWCHRVLLFRALRGLEAAIPVVWVEPFMGEEGWTFGEGVGVVEGANALHGVYRAARPDYTGRVSVPVLWDEATKTIVSNESSDLIEMFDGAFADALGQGERLFPEERREAIAAMIAANYSTVNNGVYRAGFAGSQEAYEEAVTELFARLDALEELLTTQRYLCSTDRPTAADWCLFPTLYRFDPVYHIHFKCTLRRLQDYPALWAYTRDLYQTPGVAGTCDLERTKTHYYTSHESISPRRLIPLGPQVDYDAPHGREGLGG